MEEVDKVRVPPPRLQKFWGPTATLVDSAQGDTRAIADQGARTIRIPVHMIETIKQAPFARSARGLVQELGRAGRPETSEGKSPRAEMDNPGSAR